MGVWDKFLPVKWEDSESVYKWSNGLRRSLHKLSQGPSVSDVRSGDTLAEFISQVADQDTDPQAADGVAYYFDARVQATDLCKKSFFEKTLPRMAELALRLPELLVEQSEQSKKMAGKVSEEWKESGDGDDDGVLSPLSLRVLHPQQPGIIFMSQELAASLLSCAFFSLFPIARRDEHQLPAINMGTMFEALRLRPSQTHKLHCVTNYFNRVCEAMPLGTISYERKVLPSGNNKVLQPTFWVGNHGALCSFEVMDEGIIEDAGCEYAQVDFANKFLGGGVLQLGCLQEEIRFMLSPELIVGMLFLPAMDDNEVIEITGSERFSSYTGYGGKFQYAGDFVDSAPRDSFARRCTKIIAMDAMEWPGELQFQEKLLLREVCKAYCGFLSTEKVSSISEGSDKGEYEGIATGNWGCGAFGGDLSIKSMLQWLAASEAGWSTVKYYTFQDKKAERLHEAVRHVVENKYDMGQLWSALVSYGKLRGTQEKNRDFFAWLIRTSL